MDAHKSARPCEHRWVVEAGYGPRGHGASWCSLCDAPNPATAAEAIGRSEPQTLRQAGAEPPRAKTVHGYDAAFWNESYRLLRDAITTHLDDCVQDDDVAEEAILIAAIETAAKRLKAVAAPQGAKPSPTEP